MDKKDIMGKLKDGISVQEMEDFARKYVTEIFTVAAIAIGAISSMFDFFTGPSLTILFLAIGAIIGIFFPSQTEKGLKQIYTFAFKQEKMTQMILGGVKIVVALFIPFLLFGLIGLLAGTSYHYYTRHAQMMGDAKSSKKIPRPSLDDEHD